jgi:hypothetical protein
MKRKSCPALDPSSVWDELTTVYGFNGVDLFAATTTVSSGSAFFSLLESSLWSSSPLMTVGIPLVIGVLSGASAWISHEIVGKDLSEDDVVQRRQRTKLGFYVADLEVTGDNMNHLTLTSVITGIGIAATCFALDIYSRVGTPAVLDAAAVGAALALLCAWRTYNARQEVKRSLSDPVPITRHRQLNI